MTEAPAMPSWWADLHEIQRLLDEAYANYFEKGDGHCKSAEGAIAVHFNNVFDRRHDPASGLKAVAVSVYSYVLGPQRWHYFDDSATALATVREWHAKEMARDYEAEDRFLPVDKLIERD